jgi:hypothetical protein
MCTIFDTAREYDIWDDFVDDLCVQSFDRYFERTGMRDIDGMLVDGYIQSTVYMDDVHETLVSQQDWYTTYANEIRLIATFVREWYMLYERYSIYSITVRKPMIALHWDGSFSHIKWVKRLNS